MHRRKREDRIQEYRRDQRLARDSDRRKILDDELAAKKTHLAELQKDYNNGEPDRTGDERNYQRYLDRVQAMKDNIARTQSDIDSIQGEIGKLP